MFPGACQLPLADPVCCGPNVVGILLLLYCEGATALLGAPYQYYSSVEQEHRMMAVPLVVSCK